MVFEKMWRIFQNFKKVYLAHFLSYKEIEDTFSSSDALASLWCNLDGFRENVTLDFFRNFEKVYLAHYIYSCTVHRTYATVYVLTVQSLFEDNENIKYKWVSHSLFICFKPSFLFSCSRSSSCWHRTFESCFCFFGHGTPSLLGLGTPSARCVKMMHDHDEGGFLRHFINVICSDPAELHASSDWVHSRCSLTAVM